MIRKLPANLDDYQRGQHEAGASPSYTYKNHFIKRSNEAPLEEWISRLFEHTETPGTVPVRHVDWRGSPYSIAKLVPDSITAARHVYDYRHPLDEIHSGYKGHEQVHALLQDPNHPIINAVRNMGGWKGLSNMLLSEYMTGIGDRHNNNYLVSPSAIHSIDHEDTSGNSPAMNQLLSKVFHGFPEEWISASPDHLARWDRTISNMKDTAGLKQTDPHKVPFPLNTDDFKQRLANVKSVARQHGGSVPIHELG